MKEGREIRSEGLERRRYWGAKCGKTDAANADAAAIAGKNKVKKKKKNKCLCCLIGVESKVPL